MCVYTVNVVSCCHEALAFVVAEAIPVPPAAAAIAAAAQMLSAHVFLMSLPLWPASAVGGSQDTTLG
jgi:hypothetical protein